jgi:hypothetical protein
MADIEQNRSEVMSSGEGMQEVSAGDSKADDWLSESSLVLKRILLERRMTYAGLAARLQACGYDETELSVSHKVRRGKYQTRFLYACMEALGLHEITLKMPQRGTPTSVDQRAEQLEAADRG